MPCTIRDYNQLLLLCYNL